MAQNLENLDRPAIVDLAISLDVAKPGTRLRTPRLIELIREAEAKATATEKPEKPAKVNGKRSNVLTVDFTPAPQPEEEVTRKPTGRKSTVKTTPPADQDARDGMCICHDTRPAVYGVEGKPWMRLCAERGGTLMTGDVMKHGEKWKVVKL